MADDDDQDSDEESDEDDEEESDDDDVPAGASDPAARLRAQAHQFRLDQAVTLPTHSRAGCSAKMRAIDRE